MACSNSPFAPASPSASLSIKLLLFLKLPVFPSSYFLHYEINFQAFSLLQPWVKAQDSCQIFLLCKPSLARRDTTKWRRKGMWWGSRCWAWHGHGQRSEASEEETMRRQDGHYLQRSHQGHTFHMAQIQSLEATALGRSYGPESLTLADNWDQQTF